MMTSLTMRVAGLASLACLMVACGKDLIDSVGGSGGAGGPGGGQGAGGSSWIMPAGGAGAGTGGSGAGPATCEDYCTIMMSACTAGNAQYLNEATCLAECEAFDQGPTAGDTTGENLECRQHHAGIAASGADPSLHCVHAGPLGGGVNAGNGCGTDRCFAFCDVAETVCAGVAGYPYANLDACYQDCFNFSDTVDFTLNQTSGDTLACRMYHVSVAADPINAETHCGHASGSVCFD